MPGLIWKEGKVCLHYLIPPGGGQARELGNGDWKIH